MDTGGILASIPTWLVILGLAVAGGIFAGGKWVGAVNADRTHWQSVIKKLDDGFEKINHRLDTLLMNWAGPGAVAAGASPLALTDLGQTVSREIRAKEIAQSLVPVLVPRLEGKDRYTIQQDCIEYATTELTLKQEQDSAFRTVAYETGLSMYEVLRVLGIELRDAVMKALGMDDPTDQRRSDGAHP